MYYYGTKLTYVQIVLGHEYDRGSTEVVTVFMDTKTNNYNNKIIIKCCIKYQRV